MTSTQENFGANKGFKAGAGYPTDDQEERKSGRSGNSFNNKFKSNANKASGKKGNASKKNRDDEIDSHSESDEAVDDKGALFQKRAGPYDFTGRGGLGGMNDNLDHSESEEGNNQDIPNFDGNDFVFKKRQPDDSSQV